MNQAPGLPGTVPASGQTIAAKKPRRGSALRHLEASFPPNRDSYIANRNSYIHGRFTFRRQ